MDKKTQQDKDRPYKYNPFALYFISHFQAFYSTVKESMRAPLTNLLTITILAIVIALPIGLYLVLENFQYVSAKWDDKPTLSIYLKKNASPQEINVLLGQIKAQPSVNSAEYISPQEGLRDFKNSAQFNDVLPALKHNPLPPVISVTLAQSKSSAKELRAFLTPIKDSALIDAITTNMTSWVKRLDYLIMIGRRACAALTILLGAGIILIVSNNIRSTIASRQQEISTLKLIGAQKVFIRRPFLYHGLLYGLIAGGLACALVALLLGWLAEPIIKLAYTYTDQAHFQNIDLATVMHITLYSALLGLSGAWFSITRHLNQYHDI